MLYCRAKSLTMLFQYCLPTLLVVTCPALVNPENGMVNVLNNTIGGTAVYSCAVGFNLTADSTLICGRDGEWVGEIPACEGGYE